MDPMFTKVIESRKKSISKLEAEVARYNAAMDSADSAQESALTGVVMPKIQRLQKLRAELAALEAARSKADKQVALPGTSSPSEPPAPGAVSGRGSGRR